MFVGFLDSIGDKTIKIFSSLYKAVEFTFICLIHMFNPKSYNNDMRVALIKQIYFTSIGILPAFIFLAIFFGTVFIGVIIYLATLYSLEDDIGAIIVTFAIKEFTPFFVAILIIFRTSTSVNTEIASLKSSKVDLVDNLFLPRILSGVFSVTTLSSLFTIIMLLGGYMFTLFYMNMDFHTYKTILISAVEFEDLAVLILKAAAFGFVIMIIPVYSAIKEKPSLKQMPKSILNIIVKIFIAIFFVEVFSLVIQSI